MTDHLTRTVLATRASAKAVKADAVAARRRLDLARDDRRQARIDQDHLDGRHTFSSLEAHRCPGCAAIQYGGR